MSPMTTGVERIEVVLPTRNRVNRVLSSVDSVLGQTHTNILLRVIDDASTDDTVETLASYDTRLDVFRNSERRGPSGARNIGLAVSGDLVAFQDSDDKWDREKLRLQLRVLRHLQREGIPVAAVGCLHDWMKDGGPRESCSNEIPVKLYDRVDVLLGRTNGTGTPKLLVDRLVGAPNVQFDEALWCFEDRDYVFRLLANGSALAVVQFPLISVDRSGQDHASHAGSAAESWDYLLTKYAAEPGFTSDVENLYRYNAMRSSLRAKRRRRALRQFRLISGARGRLLPEALLGMIGGELGLRVASRIGLRPALRRIAPDRSRPSWAGAEFLLDGA